MIKITQNLIETKEGICLGSNHAKNLWEGKKKLIVKSCLYKNELNKLLYLLGGSKCYGIIRLSHPSKISMSDFKGLSDKHLVSEEERKKWWPHKEVLFSYAYDLITKYDPPREVEIPNSTQMFVKEFEFLNFELEHLNNSELYNPLYASNQQLADDWQIVQALYSTKRSGGKVKHSIEEISNIAKIIHDEITRRVDMSDMVHDFARETMKPLPCELYDLVSNKGATVKNTQNAQLSTPDGHIVLKNFISGSDYSIKPIKASKHFSHSDEAVQYMFEHGLKYALEKKFKGLRAVLVKNGDKITIFSDDGKEISKFFPSARAEASRLSSKDLVLDCEITPKDELIKYLSAAEVGDENKLVFQCFDCLFFGEDLINKPWHERKQELHSLNFSNHLKEVNSIIVDSQHDAKQALHLLGYLQDSTGVMIKSYDGEYNPGEICFLSELGSTPTKSVDNADETTTDTPGIPAIQGKEFPKKKKIKDKEVENGKTT